MTTRYIIICAGEASRWGNYLGVPKHFANLNGEPILHRTIRLLTKHKISPDDIYVVSRDYDIGRVRNYTAKLNPRNHDADKFLSSHELWNKDGRTVILYGDVYFSEEAIQTIINDETPYWRLFCRPWASEITGTEYGECFAVSFFPFDHKTCKKKLKQLIHLYNGGLLGRIGGWEWSRMMAEVDIRYIADHLDDLPVYIVIDDETDDIDYPVDYERMKALLA